jgi:hypothetical protein
MRFQRHHHTDRHADAQLEVRHVLARLRDHRLLAGHRREVFLRFGEGVALGIRTDAGRDHDLLELRNLHHVLEAEFGLESAADFLVVFFLHIRHFTLLRLVRGNGIDIRDVHRNRTLDHAAVRIELALLDRLLADRAILVGRKRENNTVLRGEDRGNRRFLALEVAGVHHNFVALLDVIFFH